MIILVVLGAVLVAVGLLLFWKDQMDDKAADSSQVTAWKINLQGPPALILVAVGALIIIFPFTSFFRIPTEPEPPVITTTTVLATETTLPGETTVAPAQALPLVPVNPIIQQDDACGHDTIFWEQPEIENVAGWAIVVESYDPDTDELWESIDIDTQRDILTFGNSSALCYFDFVNPEFVLYYYVWVWAYNDVGYSEEAMFIDYYGDLPE